MTEGGSLHLVDTYEPREVTLEQIDDGWLNSVLPLLQNELPTITLLPMRVENGVSVYDAKLTNAVKILRANGVKAAFVNGERGRVYQSNFSATTDAFIIAILVNVSSSAIWDGIKYFNTMLRSQLKGAKNSNQRIRIAAGITRHADGSSTSWQTIDGPHDLALDKLEAIIRAAIGRSRGAENTLPQPRGNDEGGND